MKKILTLAAVAVAAVALASADPVLIGHGYFGVGLGSQVTQANGDQLGKGTVDTTKNYSWNFGSNLDFGAGIGINIPFGGYFGIQPGVDFYVNNVGFHNEYTVAGSTITHDYTYSYLSLDIPLLFTVKIDNLNIYVGPYVSIPLGDVSISNDSGSVNKCDHSWGSVGALVGLGYEMRIGMGRLVFGGRYMHDFMPIELKAKDSNHTNFVDLYRGALAIDIGYKIPLSF